MDVTASLAPVLSHDGSSGIWEEEITVVLQPKEYIVKTPAPVGGGAPEPNTVVVTMVYNDRPGRELQALLSLDVSQFDADKTFMYTGTITGDNVLQKRLPNARPGQHIKIAVSAMRLFGGDEPQPFSAVYSFIRS